MKKKTFLRPVWLLLAMGGIGGPGEGQETIAPLPEPLVTLTMGDVPVNVLLEMISEIYGIPIQVDYLGPVPPVVSLDVKETPLSEVVRMLVRMANITVVRKGDGSYHVSPGPRLLPAVIPSIADLPENLIHHAYLEVTDMPLAEALQQLVDGVAATQNRGREIQAQQLEDRRRRQWEEKRRADPGIEEYQPSAWKFPHHVWKVVVDASVPPNLTVTAQIQAVPLRKALAVILDQTRLRAAYSVAFTSHEQVHTLIVTPYPTATVSSSQEGPLSQPTMAPPPEGLSLSRLRALPVLLQKAPALLISATLSRPATVNVRILDSQSPVRHVVADWIAPAGPLNVVWDGCDEEGQRVREGVYRCQVEVGNPGRGIVQAIRTLRVGPDGTIRVPPNETSDNASRSESALPRKLNPTQGSQKVWKEVPLKYLGASVLAEQWGGITILEEKAPPGVAGIDTLIGYPARNALVVQGSPEGIAELEEIISMVDVPPIEVELQIRFIQVPPEATGLLNIKWAIDSPGGMRCAVGDFLPQVKALQAEKQISPVSVLTLKCQDGLPGWVKIGRTGAQEKWGLMVLPRVTGIPPNESITLNLRPADATEFPDPRFHQSPGLFPSSRFLNGKSKGFGPSSDPENRAEDPSRTEEVGKGETTKDPEDPGIILRISNGETVALAGWWETLPEKEGELLLFVRAQVVRNGYRAKSLPGSESWRGKE